MRGHPCVGAHSLPAAQTPCYLPILSQGPLCPGWGYPCKALPQHMAPPTLSMRQEEWAVASTLPWDLLPGLNHWELGMGGEDPAPPELTTGMNQRTRSSLRDTLLGHGAWLSVWDLSIPLPGMWWGKLGCCQSVAPPSPSPNQAVHRRLLNSLECNPGI